MTGGIRTSLSVIQAGVALLFVLALLFTGGSSRVDVPTLLAVRLTAVLAIAVIVIFADGTALRRYFPPVALLVFTAAWMVLQLIPLPPALWLALPGRDFYAGVARVTGQSQPWRPLTLSPDLTLEALIGLLAPLAAILLGMRMPRAWITQLPLALLILAAASACLAIFQISGGEESALRLYPVVDTDSGVGFFANRNHQALLMSMGIPAAVWWSLSETKSQQTRLLRLVVGAMGVLLCILAAMITGSRAGILLTALAMMAGVAAMLPKVSRWLGLRGILALAAVIAVMCLAALVVLPYDRLAVDLREDPRLGYWRSTADLIAAFFPLGSGAGSFVRVFPRFETLDMLRPEYINHAHSDYLELVADNGIAGALLIGVFLLVFVRWCVVAGPRTAALHSPLPAEMAVARLALVLVALGLIASAVDYPLRAPLMGSLFAVACVVIYRVFSDRTD